MRRRFPEVGKIGAAFSRHWKSGRGGLGAALVFAAILAAPDAGAAPPWPSYTVSTFADEFDGTNLDSSVWGIYDSRTNLTVADGQLYLNTVRLGTNWQGGGVRTRAFRQKFGWFECRMQIAGADGLNNAFWLNTPQDANNDYDQLEIDITEAHFHDEFHMNVHDWKPTHTSSGATLATDLYPGFHLVGLEWATDGTLRWYLDGAAVRTFSAASLNAYNSMLPLELLFSTKVFPWAGTPGPGLEGTHMDVDWVRAWQKPGWLGRGSGAWGAATNWGPDGIPGPGDAAIFNGGSSNRTLSLAADTACKEVYFGTEACAAYTFAAGHTLRLAAPVTDTCWGGVTLNADVTNRQVFLVDLFADNPLVFANYNPDPAVTLDLRGDITSDETSRTICVAGGGRVNLAGALSGRIGALVRYNPGELLLAAANGHTGLTRVENGTVIVAADGALGVTGGSSYSVVYSGATLALASGVVYATAESLHLAGSGEYGRQGALDLYDSRAAEYDGPIHLDANATIASGASGGTLTLGSFIDTKASAFALTLRGNGETEILGGIRGAGDVLKSGGGRVVVRSACTYSGATVVSAGTLVVEGSLGATEAVDVTNTAIVELTGAITSSVVRVATGATFRFNGEITGTMENRGTVRGDGGGTSMVHGAIENRGLIRLTGLTVFSASGGITNFGTIDAIQGGPLPANVVNFGTILTPEDVFCAGVSVTGADIRVTLPSVDGHTNQLQRNEGWPVAIWTNTGSPKAGTGGPLVFTDPGGAAMTGRCYRVLVLP